MHQLSSLSDALAASQVNININLLVGNLSDLRLEDSHEATNLRSPDLELWPTQPPTATVAKTCMC
jgi:hypothetical protein